MASGDKYVVKREFDWKIENVTEETVEKLDGQCSEEFTILIGPNNTKWYFECEKSRVKETIGVFLIKKSVDSDDFLVKLDFDYIGKCRIGYHFEIKSNSFKLGVKKGCAIFTNIDTVFDKSMQCLSEDNTLTIHITLVLEQVKEKIKAPEVNNLYSKCSKFFNSEEFSDFTCVSSDRTKIPVHRVILADQSPVLYAMFNAQMQESNTKEVNITDIDGEVLLELFRFMYTGKVENLEANAASLIFAAEKYDVKELKNLCASSLIANLSKANIFDTTIIADRCNQTVLLYECLEFLEKNYCSLFGNVEWKKIDRALMHKIMNWVVQDSRSSIQLNSIL